MSLPQGVKKHIRKKKAQIRREFTDTKKQKEEIDQLYQKFLDQYQNNADSN